MTEAKLISDARLDCRTVSIRLEVPGAPGQENRAHHLDVSLAYHEGRLWELVFVGRGKIGHGLDLMLHDLGLKISRAIQERDPETGDAINPTAIQGET